MGREEVEAVGVAVLGQGSRSCLVEIAKSIHGVRLTNVQSLVIAGSTFLLPAAAACRARRSRNAE